MKFSETSPAPLSITVNISLQGGIKAIDSPTHKITVSEKTPVPQKPNWTCAVAKLSGSTTDMDRDFVLLIIPHEIHTPRLYSEVFGNSTAVMTHLIPSFNLEDQKVELILILDRSGSMMGQSIDLAKRALTLFLHSLPVECYFNVVGFGSTFEFLFPESVKYGVRSLKKAVAHVKALQANLEGTELLEPLKEVFNKKLIPGHLRQIFVLTDGEISNTVEVLGLTSRNAHVGRLFSLGIGDSCSHHLLEDLAEAGGGTSSFVTYNESIDAKVLQQLKNAIQPSLSEVSVEWIGVEKHIQVQPKMVPKINTKMILRSDRMPVEPLTTLEKSYNQVPEKIPPIYDGSQLLVFGLFEKSVPTGVNIKAESPDGQLTDQIEFDKMHYLGSTGMLHKLAAIKLVRELEMKIDSFSIGYFGYEDEDALVIDVLKKEIIAVSCKHGISSKYTSFIAVDTFDQKSNENWVMQTRHFPTQHANYCHGDSGRRFPKRTDYMGGIVNKNKAFFWTKEYENLHCWLRIPPRLPPSIRDHDDGNSPPKRGRGRPKGGGKKKTSRKASPSKLVPMASKRKLGATSSQAKTTVHDLSDNELDSMGNEEEFGHIRKAAKLETQDYLHALVTTQSFNGSFRLNDKFAKSIGQKLDDLKQEVQKLKLDEVAFATALALAYFSGKLANWKDSWELVEGKAKKWLIKKFPDAHANILNAAVEYVKGIASLSPN